MMAKFAKAIAANIRVIAESAAHIQAIDSAYGGQDRPNEVYQGRAELHARMKKAEKNIAALLQQPGASLSD